MKSLNNLNNWFDIQEHQKLGEILMQSGALSLEELGMALDIQNFDKLREGTQLGTILVIMKVISQEQLDQALILQKQIDEKLEKKGL